MVCIRRIVFVSFHLLESSSVETLPLLSISCCSSLWSLKHFFQHSRGSLPSCLLTTPASIASSNLGKGYMGSSKYFCDSVSSGRTVSIPSLDSSAPLTSITFIQSSSLGHQMPRTLGPSGLMSSLTLASSVPSTLS